MMGKRQGRDFRKRRLERGGEREEREGKDCTFRNRLERREGRGGKERGKYISKEEVGKR